MRVELVLLDGQRIPFSGVQTVSIVDGGDGRGKSKTPNTPEPKTGFSVNSAGYAVLDDLYKRFPYPVEPLPPKRLERQFPVIVAAMINDFKLCSRKELADRYGNWAKDDPHGANYHNITGLKPR